MREGVLIHTGINYVITPVPELKKRNALRFHSELIEEGVDISETQYKNSEAFFHCQDPIRIAIKVGLLAPNVGQLLVVGPERPGTVDLFAEHVDAIVRAYENTWPHEVIRILSSDVTLRILYETDEEHAFKELWENRLKQGEESLSLLGGPILGGGLRFVIPRTDSQVDEPHIIELKIESWLQDPSKIFIEVLFKWEQIRVIENNFNAKERLKAVDSYIDEKVSAFIDWREGEL